MDKLEDVITSGIGAILNNDNSEPVSIIGDLESGRTFELKQYLIIDDLLRIASLKWSDVVKFIDDNKKIHAMDKYDLETFKNKLADYNKLVHQGGF